MTFEFLPKNIDNTLTLCHLSPQHAKPLFELTDQNREFLKPWFPWIEFTNQLKDTEKFITDQSKLFRDNKSIQIVIKRDSRIIGMTDYHEIDLANEVGKIGYWLGEVFNGNGFMTSVVREMISIGFDHLELNRIEIHCATSNNKSRAIPERLGFTLDGVLRCAEKVNGCFQDHAVYVLLKNGSEN